VLSNRFVTFGENSLLTDLLIEVVSKDYDLMLVLGEEARLDHFRNPA